MLSRAKHLLLFVYGSDKQILRCPLPLRGGEAPAQNDRAVAVYTFTRNGVEDFETKARPRGVPAGGSGSLGRKLFWLVQAWIVTFIRCMNVPQ